MDAKSTDVLASGTSGAQTEVYVRSWFLPFATLVRQSGGTAQQIEALLVAGAAPGAIYARRSDGSWWSALDAFRGHGSAEPPAQSEGWYTPAALYWLRRALLALRESASPTEAAERNREAFLGQFIDALKTEALAPSNYPEAFSDAEMIDIEAARRVGATEWDYWLSGAYAVCLRSFTGETCVTKESLAKAVKAELAADERTMSDFALLDVVERLNSVMIPFAPSERPLCTPGVTVDRVLELLELGREEPYDREAYVRTLENQPRKTVRRTLR